MAIDSRRPVLSTGEILIDLIVSDGATDLEQATSFASRPGGAPANAAVALARQGLPAAFCGVAGDDPFGRRLVSTLDEELVDRTRLRLSGDAATTLAFAWKDQRGDGHFSILRMADKLLSPSDIERADIPTLSALVVGSVSLSEEPSRSAIVRAVALAAEHGIPICIDVNMRPTLWQDRQSAVEACELVLPRATLIKLSLDDARFLLELDHPEDIFHVLSRYPAGYIVLTDGARGSWFAVRRQDGLSAPERVPAFEIDAVDPTGAGDAFTAAIIARLIEHNWRDLARDDAIYASAAGALTTTRRGAIASLPTSDEIRAFLDSAGAE
jgi:fructokinase